MPNPLKEQSTVINSQLAAHLRHQRHMGNFTMRQLAIDLGTPHSFVGKIESQNRRMNVGEFILYCQKLNRDPVEVLQEVIDLAGAVAAKG